MTPEIIRELVMGGAPDVEVEAALRHPDCPAGVLKFVLAQGKMDFASKLAFSHPHCPDLAAHDWNRKHRRTILPHPADPLQLLSMAQARLRRYTPGFPHVEADEIGSFKRYFETQFRTHLLQFVLAIPPVERHSPFQGRRAHEYEDIDTSYFANNFFFPFGTHRAAERMALEHRMQTGLDDVVFQPIHIRKWKRDDQPDPMSNIPRKKLAWFAAGLFWMSLLDRLVEIHHQNAQDKWHRLTRFPQFDGVVAVGNVTQPAVHRILADIKTRFPPESTRTKLPAELKDAVANSLADMAEFWFYFIGDNFDPSEIDPNQLIEKFGEVIRRYL